MQAGTIIKSYDFPGNLDCYMIGRVVDIIDEYILCDTIKVVFDSQEQPIKETRKQFRTVKQGCMFMDTEFQRVVIVG